MWSALKRIFGGKTKGSSNGIQVNQDAAFFTEQRPQGRGKRNAMSQSGQPKQPLPWTNPLDKFGKRSRCAFCQCTFHWAKDGPHKKTEQVRITEDATLHRLQRPLCQTLRYS